MYSADDPRDEPTRPRRAKPPPCSMQIPCKYPDKGPMLYEMLEYCAELTRQSEAARRAAPSRVTSSSDGFLYPRGFDEAPDAAKEAEEQKMTQAQREAAWVNSIEERIHRRRRAEAGYHPDISQGVRRLNDPDEPEEEPGAPAPLTAAGAGAAASEAPAARRYGVVLREVDGDAPVKSAAAAPATLNVPIATDGAAKPAAAAPTPSVAAVLRRVFAADHPGVAPMCAWLAEEGVHTAAELRALLAGGDGSKGGAAALRQLGFRQEWAAAAAAGFARAAAAAEKEAAASTA